MILFNPNTPSRFYPDETSRQIMLKTIDFFEGRGLKKMKEDFHACKWYTEFLDFMKENQIMINRKILADLAVRDPNAFSTIVRNAQVS